MNTTLSANFPVALTYDLFPINTEYGIIYAALVLIGLYVLIITEVSIYSNNVIDKLFFIFVTILLRYADHQKICYYLSIILM